MSTNKRLVISGFPCPAKPWQEMFDDDLETKVLTFFEVLDAVKKPDFKLMGKFVASEIEGFKPTSIVCHDYGSPTTLMALMYMHKKKTLPQAKVTVFNGAFRDFNVLTNRHPIRLQFASWQLFSDKMSAAGFSYDERLEPYFGVIKGLYRRLAALSLLRQVQKVFRKDPGLQLNLGIPMQMIFSPKDQYIDEEAMLGIKNDFCIESMHTVDYPHFPYIENKKASYDLVRQFEQS